MSPAEAMHRIDALLSHVWMVRTFLKHSEEAEEDQELMEIVRVLYDYCLSLGPALNAQDADAYLKLARKKFARLRQAADDFARVYPEVSAHTNFKMCAASLTTSVEDVGRILETAVG